MKFDAVKKQELLDYVEGIAVIYYQKHNKVFEKDSVSLNDLKQEARIICLLMIKGWGRKDGKNNFDIKKFASRAVGWKMNTMLRGAIIQSKNTVNLSDYATNTTDEGDSSNFFEESTDFENHNSTHKEDFFEDIDPRLVHGFNIKDIFKHFVGKDLTILKKMIECKSISSIQKETGYKNRNSIREAWNNRIKPKVLLLLKDKVLECKENLQ